VGVAGALLAAFALKPKKNTWKTQPANS